MIESGVHVYIQHPRFAPFSRSHPICRQRYYVFKPRRVFVTAPLGCLARRFQPLRGLVLTVVCPHRSPGSWYPFPSNHVFPYMRATGPTTYQTTERPSCRTQTNKLLRAGWHASLRQSNGAIDAHPHFTLKQKDGRA